MTTFKLQDGPLAIADPALHTMGENLRRYVQSRVHEYVDGDTYSRIKVLGSYDRSLAVSAKEKRDKRENWQRPTARLSADTLEIHCYPGRAYVYHYGSLIATHLALTNRDPAVVEIALPSSAKCESEIAQAGFDRLDPTRSVVVASGNDMLAPPGSVWNDRGAFEVRADSAASITWMAVKHSFWGDIAYHLGRALGMAGFLRVVFVGKLGSLVSEHEPNLTLATGDTSELDGQDLAWENTFSDYVGSVLVSGPHVTLPSVLQETVEWRAQNEERFSFVDPEIGNFAAGALSTGASFSYAHIVSDNLSRKYVHDLSNEREPVVVARRAAAYKRLAQILTERLAV